MEIETLLIQSLQLLGLGMGAVFVILTALIGLIALVAKLVPEEARPAVSSPHPGVPKDHVAAIVAAIHLHKRKR